MSRNDPGFLQASPESTKCSLWLARVIDLQDGKHGPYAVSILSYKGQEFSVTFSLNNDVWNQDTLPERGTIVILHNPTLKRAGWRASSARFYRLLDEGTKFINSQEFLESQAMSTLKGTEQPVGLESATG
jgi:hypothetical protein